MPKKRSDNKNLIILSVIILIGILLGGIFYFNKPQQNDLAANNEKVTIPQTSDSINQKPGVQTNQTDTSEKVVTSEKKDISDKKVKTKKSIRTKKTVKKDDGNISGTKVMPDDTVQGRIIVLPDIDYKDLKKNQALKQLMVSRKEELGFKKSLDMIVNSDESFKVGDVQIPLRDILEKATFKEGEVFEEKIEDSGEVQPETIKKFGIYVVQPGDNIWNIHFNILKEFYEHQGIKISHRADEPSETGMSSGVGKILKFSETMVIIYNFVEKKIDTNIQILEPLSKIIIYNMDEIFSLLQEVNYENIDRIQFDGKTIWVPTKKL